MSSKKRASVSCGDVSFERVGAGTKGFMVAKGHSVFGDNGDIFVFRPFPIESKGLLPIGTSLAVHGSPVASQG